MNAQTWLTLLGALGIPVIMTALIKLVENRFTLKASQPKNAAEAVDIGIGSQKKVIETLVSENARMDTKLQAAEVELGRLRVLLDEARTEMREAAERQREQAFQFREAVGALLAANDIDLPPWWHTRPPEGPPFPPDL